MRIGPTPIRSDGSGRTQEYLVEQHASTPRPEGRGPVQWEIAAAEREVASREQEVNVAQDRVTEEQQRVTEAQEQVDRGLPGT